MTECISSYCHHCRCRVKVCPGQYLALVTCDDNPDYSDNMSYHLHIMARIMNECYCLYCEQAFELADELSGLQEEFPDMNAWHVPVPCCIKCPHLKYLQEKSDKWLKEFDADMASTEEDRMCEYILDIDISAERIQESFERCNFLKTNHNRTR